MSNALYRSFVAKCLRAGCGVSPPADAVTFYAYAVNVNFAFNATHSTLSDIPGNAIGIKSESLPITLNDDGSLTCVAVPNLFNSEVLTAMTGLIFTGEWMDGDIAKNMLIAHVDTWDQSTTPVSTSENIKLAFTGNFVFRLGSVAALA